jgi:hypothetical protein
VDRGSGEGVDLYVTREEKHKPYTTASGKVLCWNCAEELPPPGDRDGETYDHSQDYVRLNAQAQRVWDQMEDGKWYTLAHLSRATSDPEASISARLRDFRKNKFGSHTVKRRRVNSTGLWEYQLVRKE